MMISFLFCFSYRSLLIFVVSLTYTFRALLNIEQSVQVCDAREASYIFRCQVNIYFAFISSYKKSSAFFVGNFCADMVLPSNITTLVFLL